MVIDLRGNQSASGPPQAGKLAHGKLVMRDPSIVDAICLHQTGCGPFGASKAAIKAAGGDVALARHRRALGVHAHMTAFQDGTSVAAYPLMAYVWHGHGSNSRSIGLEIEGLYNGQPLGALSEPTPQTIQAAREACTWLVEAAKRDGATIRHVVAHRQYAQSRRSDPGWALWQSVAIEHCERVLGLTSLPNLTDRNGRPIPRSWDIRQAVAY